MRFALALFALVFVACGGGTDTPDTQGSPLLQSGWLGDLVGVGRAGSNAQVNLNFGPQSYRLRVQSLATPGRPECWTDYTDTRVWSVGPTANTITVATTYTRTTTMRCDGGTMADPERTETLNGPAIADAIVTAGGCRIEFRPTPSETFQLRRATGFMSPNCTGQ